MKMDQKLQWDNMSFTINGEKQFLVSGEFHYFRIPQKDWSARLDYFKEAGGNCVATYVPWVLHEPEEGTFAFGDTPHRDLEYFLTLCQEKNLLVVCRPGPYVYSEMHYGGLPEWLCVNYPQILAKNQLGEDLKNVSVSYLHPLFLEKAKNWYDKVCPILNKYTVTNGGCIAAVQVDNELIGFHEWFGSWDHNPETMGFGQKDGRYPSYLNQHYKSIEELNQAYATNYLSFEEVRPYHSMTPQTIYDRRRMKDYQNFYFETVGEYASTLISWLREHGIDSPIVHNSANPNMNSYFLETVEQLGSQFLLGSDHYYNLDQSWEQNHPTPQYATKVFYSLEMLRMMGFPPSVFEMPAGSASDWPPILSEDLNCCYMLNVAFGMKGLNYYVFTGGPDNPHNLSFKSDYDYNAPIGSDNSIRPKFSILKKFGSFMRENAWLQDASLVTDIQVGLIWEYTRSKHYFSSQEGKGLSNVQAWNFVNKGIVTSAFCGSITPGFADLSSENWIQEIQKPLWVATSACMSRVIQERLVRFIQRGGKVVLLPTIPENDEDFKTCTVLKDYLMTLEHRKTYQQKGKDLNEDTEMEKMSVETLLQSTDFKQAGYYFSTHGEGAVIWLKRSWQHTYKQHSAIMHTIHQEFKAQEMVVQCDNPYIWCALRSNGEKQMLFVMNLFSSPVEGNIRTKKTDGSMTETQHYRLQPMEVRTVLVD